MEPGTGLSLLPCSAWYAMLCLEPIRDLERPGESMPAVPLSSAASPLADEWLFGRSYTLGIVSV